MRQELSDAELEIYARQIVLADIGYEGQLKLRNAKACIIGLGGLGTLIAPKLGNTCMMSTLWASLRLRWRSEN